jgi:hypothetical protein
VSSKPYSGPKPPQFYRSKERRDVMYFTSGFGQEGQSLL